MIRRILKDDAFLLCEVESKSIKDYLENEDSIKEMNEEVEQIEKKITWMLVPRLKEKNVIGTRWVSRNKINEKGEVGRNNRRLVCKGYA